MEPNWSNRTLFHGDNLDFLRSMNSGTVHLIATDPPFNKGRDFHATPDSLAAGARFQDRWSWADDVEGEWVDQIQDDWPAVWEVIDASRAAWGDDMAAFLCFMGVRLIEMRRVLRDDGSLYLHCDPTASHYLKALLDAIFGKQNFRNEIVWCYEVGGRSKRQFGRKHDVILYFARSATTAFNADAVRLPRRRTHMKVERDADGREWQVKTDARTGKVYRYSMDAGHCAPTGGSGFNSSIEAIGSGSATPRRNHLPCMNASSGQVVMRATLFWIHSVGAPPLLSPPNA